MSALILVQDGQDIKRCLYPYNVARGKTASASREYTGAGAGYVTDGNYNTAWNAGVSTTTESVAVDLGAVYPIKSVKITLDNFSKVTLYGSLNGSTWTSLQQIDTNVEVTLSAVANYRYFSVSNFVGGGWVNVREFELFAQAWETVGQAPATEAMFTTYGMASADNLVEGNLKELTSASPTILMYDPLSAAHTVTVTAAPASPKLILPKADIRTQRFVSMTSATLTSTVSGNGVIRLIASNDKGITWKTFDGTNWVTIDATNLATVKASGMTPAVLNAITAAQWLALLGSGSAITPLRFGYYLEIAASTDVASTDLLTITAAMQGTWGVATPGTDYKYGYIGSEILQVKIYSNGDFKINY